VRGDLLGEIAAHRHEQGDEAVVALLSRHRRARVPARCRPRRGPEGDAELSLAQAEGLSGLGQHDLERLRARRRHARKELGTKKAADGIDDALPRDRLALLGIDLRAPASRHRRLGVAQGESGSRHAVLAAQ
jgi:hypothetical protein